MLAKLGGARTGPSHPYGSFYFSFPPPLLFFSAVHAHTSMDAAASVLGSGLTYSGAPGLPYYGVCWLLRVFASYVQDIPHPKGTLCDLLVCL